jgi:hypothetical protein
MTQSRVKLHMSQQDITMQLKDGASSVCYLIFVGDVCVCVEICVLMCMSLNCVRVYVLVDIGRPKRP